MYRGEPLALYTILFGLINFNMVLFFGIRLSGLISFKGYNFVQVHYILAYFMWILPVVLGSQLQFFRSLTGLRKYEPNILRKYYLLSLILSTIMMVTGTFTRTRMLLIIGILVLISTVTIHSYWLVRVIKDKRMHFPLNFFFISNLYLVISMVYILFNIDRYAIIENKDFITHMLSFGWINLSLQGAILRILPMFIGKSINLRLKRNIEKLHIYSTVISFLIILLYYFRGSLIIDYMYYLTLVLFILSWVWIIYELARIITHKKNQYLVTLIYFITGIFLMFGGIVLALFIDYNYIVIKRLHIHFSLLFGLAFLMLGAIHRITSFQIHTLLYIGRDAPSVNKLLKPKIFTIIAIGMLITFIFMTFGFVYDDFIMVGLFGFALLLLSLAYTVIIFNNYLKYWRNRSTIIPFDKKASEI